MLSELNDIYKIILTGIMCLWILTLIFKDRFQKYLGKWVISIIMVIVILLSIFQLYDIFINNKGNYFDIFFYIVGIFMSIKFLLNLQNRKY